MPEGKIYIIYALSQQVNIHRHTFCCKYLFFLFWYPTVSVSITTVSIPPEPFKKHGNNETPANNNNKTLTDIDEDGDINLEEEGDEREQLVILPYPCINSIIAYRDESPLNKAIYTIGSNIEKVQQQLDALPQKVRNMTNLTRVQRLVEQKKRLKTLFQNVVCVCG